MVQELISLFAVFITMFLFGMTVMRTGLQNLSQENLKQTLLLMTNTPLKGLLVGTMITAVLQSSSAVMVIVIGLVAAGYMTFKQSIGIILGTNIGTTVTAEIIAFDLSFAIIPLLIVGAILLNVRNQIAYCMGCISFGLGTIFVAMHGLEKLAYPLASIPFTYSFFELTNDNQLVGIGIGTILSAIIQSSTATTAIAMGFINQHILTLPAGIAIILGANIGTCFTALLASIGSNSTAKLVAYAHIWLNILGVLLFIPLIEWLSFISSTLTTIPNLQLAHASTIFNIITSLLALPLVGVFSKFILLLHGNKTAA